MREYNSHGCTMYDITLRLKLGKGVLPHKLENHDYH